MELGPGTGAVSAAIEERLQGRGRHIALESDPSMAHFLHRKNPRAKVHLADAVDLGSILARERLADVDAVVSGLPWALISADKQKRILGQIAHSLAPSGVFTTFAYVHGLGLTAARHFGQSLRSAFDEVLSTRTVWVNFPPAITYVCRRPRRAASIEISA
ncbi:hypothetical protein GCM10011609_76270 [Lentzea pudingi]|uniref:Methyltransferase domain-containing protein n=1 Tax=Lentzea pudingi TaxID=1789439 RepID=A0ABQ2INM9_9PSEU|nr:hypothetical protein GCM10011609_76270 [Lentzea pudingi]